MVSSAKPQTETITQRDYFRKFQVELTPQDLCSNLELKQLTVRELNDVSRKITCDPETGNVSKIEIQSIPGRIIDKSGQLTGDPEDRIDPNVDEGGNAE